MYTAYFGFNSKPFKSKDPKEFYRNTNLDEVCSDILGGIRERRGPILLTGEAGVGKTLMLHRCVAEAGDIRFIWVNGADLDSTDILDYLCTNLNLQVTGLDTERRNRVLLEALAAQERQCQTIGLWIDDAHLMPAEVPKRLQAVAEAPVPQVVLAGPPNLASELDRPKWRGLGNRIRVHCCLERLSKLETGLFIDHQLKVAGYGGRELFSPAAIERISAYCRGVPRAIAILCDTILLFASLQSERFITPELVDAAARTCFLDERSRVATQIGHGQPGGAAASETPSATAAEHADLDLDLSEFDFSFDFNEQAMRAKLLAKMASVELATQATAVVPPASSAEAPVATTAERIADEPSFEPWHGMMPDLSDADSFSPPEIEIQALPSPAPPPQLGRHQLDSDDVPRKRDLQTSVAESSAAPPGGSPQAGIDARGVEHRGAKWPFGNDIDSIPFSDSHTREGNETDASGKSWSAAEDHPWLAQLINSNTNEENPMSRLDQINKILKNLQNESPGVEASALISEDGLMIASALPQDLDETRVAGMTATLLNLGTRAGSELRRGDVQEVIVRGENGYSVMISAGRDSLLLVLANENSKLGLIFFDMREAIKAIKQVL